MPSQPKLPPGMIQRGKSYCACFRAHGRLVRKRLSSDLEAAKKILRKLRAQADCADFDILDNDVSLEDLRKEYDRHHRLTVKPLSYKRSCGALDNVLGGISARKVKQLNAGVLNVYRELRQQKVSPRTVNIEVGALSAMLAWAVSDHMIGSNPLAYLKALPTKGLERKRRRSLSEAEVLAILDATPAYLKPVFRLFVTSGVRNREARSLTFADVDFERATITVREKNSKTGNSRAIPLDEEMLGMIEELYRNAPFRLPGKGNTEANTKRIAAKFSKKHIFVTQANTPWEGGKLLRRFYAVCQRVGIEGAEPNGSVDIHALRGTVTTLAMEGGAVPKDVQTMNGHSTLKMTMDAYAHSTEQSQRAVVSALPYAKAAQPKHATPFSDVRKMCASDSQASLALSEVVAS